MSLSAKFYLLSFGLETLPENHLKSGWSTLYCLQTEPIQTITPTGVERIFGTAYKRRLKYFFDFLTPPSPMSAFLYTSDHPNVRYGRTSTVWFNPNDRTYFCRTQNFFLYHKLHFSKRQLRSFKLDRKIKLFRGDNFRRKYSTTFKIVLLVRSGVPTYLT